MYNGISFEGRSAFAFSTVAPLGDMLPAIET
jgi:hypothetical protein